LETRDPKKAGERNRQSGNDGAARARRGNALVASLARIFIYGRH
jgi:hypothetical protein